jgi:hypothetical protein
VSVPDTTAVTTTGPATSSAAIIERRLEGIGK